MEGICILVSAKYIDKVGINSAIFYGIRKGLRKLHFQGEPVWIDGNYKIPGLVHESFVRGDSMIKTISAASILAKVGRDEFLLLLSKKFPQYEFEKHKGYGTELHRKNLERYGISRVHRLSFLRKFRETVHENLELFPNAIPNSSRRRTQLHD